jgi:hypothetical protein
LKNYGEDFKTSDRLYRNITYQKPKQAYISAKKSSLEKNNNKEIYCKKIIKNKTNENINPEIKCSRSAIFKDNKF